MMLKWMVICSDGDVKYFDELHKATSFMADLLFIECKDSQLYRLNSQNYYEFREEL